MKDRCDRCKKWLRQGSELSTLEGIVDGDFNFGVCKKCLERYNPQDWNQWVAKIHTKLN